MTKQRKPSLSQLFKQHTKVRQVKNRVWEEERKANEMAKAANGSEGIVEDSGIVYRVTASYLGYGGSILVEELGSTHELKEVIK
jgi:hypothetical protein